MATDPLSLAFIGCFLIGLGFLLIMALTGHAHIHHLGGTRHAHLLHSVATTRSSIANGHGQLGAQPKYPATISLLSYLHPMSFALFLLGFGFLGYVFHNAIAPLALQFSLAIAAVGGILLALLFLVMLHRIFGDSEGQTVQDVSDRTGLLGKVSMTIGHNSLGEISYISPGGMRKSVPARSCDGQRLERDQEVVVVNCQNGIAEVDTWEHFVDQQAATFPQASPLSAQQMLLEAEGQSTAIDDSMRKGIQKE